MEYTAALEGLRSLPSGSTACVVRGHETGPAHAHKALNDRADQLAVAAASRARHAYVNGGG